MVACTHCQLPVPSGLLVQGVSEQFCCTGCQTVSRLLHAEGLEAFYAICDQVASKPLQARSINDDFTEFDDAGFHASYVRDLGQNIKEVKIILEGIHCAACVWLIEKLPVLCHGVLDARVQLMGQQATIRWNPEQTRLSLVAKSLAQLGYLAHPATDERRVAVQQRENHSHLLNLGIAGLCAGNAMLLAFALYGGLFDGISPEHATLLRWVSAFLGIIALVWPGSTFFRGAWQALRTRTPHMDVSLSIGLAAGAIMGVINTVLGTGEIYFDSLCMLIFVLLIGRYLQFRQQRRAAESLSLLRSLTPRIAQRVQPDGQIVRVPTSSLRPGDEVEVRVGDLVPADGIILTGRSTLDQSLLTGESVGVVIEPGQIVTAGATNLSAALRVRVAAIGKSSRIGRLMDLVESVSLARAPIIELANRISGVFLYVVLFLACCTLALWWSAGPETALNHVIALLIVACPCALGLATPMTIAIAQGRAARQKILIRQSDVFERLQDKGMLWLDKTGTLTEGKVKMKAWHGNKEIMPHVIALETGIVHPLAQALCQSLRERLGEQVAVPTVQEQTYEAGMGVHGKINHLTLHVGTQAFLIKHGIEIGMEHTGQVEEYLEQGWTPVYLASQGKLLAVAALGDTLRPEAYSSLETLRKQGWQIGILSGDHQAVVSHIARQLDVPAELARGDVLPEEKMTIVKNFLPQGQKVVMVGDGVNDAAALAAASVGIAVHGGAEAALQAAPVYLGRPGLEPLVELFDGSKRTLNAIRRGLIVSLAYNLTAIGLAIAGCITPLVAAILMPISSLTVTLLAIRQHTFTRKP
ncbi:MAG TPA: heavy metal translocating P-type ATPase [Gemmatales bacterium]|nr:heavy metal translocating P-type ATPase [Gemmatales bacterium]